MHAARLALYERGIEDNAFLYIAWVDVLSLQIPSPFWNDEVSCSAIAMYLSEYPVPVKEYVGCQHVLSGHCSLLECFSRLHPS
jgi:hypothetical protein